MNKLRMLELARCGIISEMEKEEFKVEKQKLYLKKIKQGSYKGGKSFCKIIEDINFCKSIIQNLQQELSYVDNCFCEFSLATNNEF